ncbi:MAG: hypothetical protein ACP5QA_16325 [Phycisphaerae bacterium]
MQFGWHDELLPVAISTAAAAPDTLNYSPAEDSSPGIYYYYGVCARVLRAVGRAWLLGNPAMAATLVVLTPILVRR